MFFVDSRCTAGKCANVIKAISQAVFWDFACPLGAPPLWYKVEPYP